MNTITTQSNKAGSLLIPVITLEQCMEVAYIRNATLGTYTNNNTVLLREDQIAFFNQHIATGAWDLFLAEGEVEFVGFALIREIDSKYWITLGVLPTYQGQGYGADIYAESVAYIRKRYKRSAWIEIFADNRPSLIAALKAGFQIRYVTDRTVYLENDTII